MHNKFIVSIVWLSALADFMSSSGQSNETARLVVQKGHSAQISSIAFRKVTEVAQSECPFSVRSSWPVLTSHNFKVVS
jgi:hypothetical protein